MRNLFIIAAFILSLVLAELLIFIPHRTGKTIQKVMEICPTTSEIRQIMSEVNPPFSNTDTLFLETAMILCGNAPDGCELPLPPQPEDLPFIEKLRTWAHSTAPSKKEFDRIMDTIVIYGVTGNKNANNGSKRNKIFVLVNLELSKKDGQFIIYENYLYADTFRSVLKKLKFDRTTRIKD